MVPWWHFNHSSQQSLRLLNVSQVLQTEKNKGGEYRWENVLEDLKSHVWKYIGYFS